MNVPVTEQVEQLKPGNYKNMNEMEQKNGLPWKPPF